MALVFIQNTARTPLCNLLASTIAIAHLVRNLHDDHLLRVFATPAVTASCDVAVVYPLSVIFCIKLDAKLREDVTRYMLTNSVYTGSSKFTQGSHKETSSHAGSMCVTTTSRDWLY